jgi:hypothetical protein
MVNVIDKLEHMIRLQRELQERTYGFNFIDMKQAEWIQYIRDQHQALGMELSEVLDEVDWKPWTTNERPPINRDAFVGELIDVIHFWLNMLFPVCAKMTPTEIADEVFTRFAMKNRVNAERQANGYDGVSTKCGGCGRALDDIAVRCTREGDQGYCTESDSDINYIKVLDERGDPGLLIITPIKPTICDFCKKSINEFGCVPPTTERWGHCGLGERQLPPIKLPTS